LIPKSWPGDILRSSMGLLMAETRLGKALSWSDSDEPRAWH